MWKIVVVMNCYLQSVRQAKIVGGSEAAVGEFPYQVSLTYNDEFVCGGSILSTLLILTAAHCVKYSRPSRLKVTAGEHDRSGFLNGTGYLTGTGSGSEQVRTARYIYLHESYVWETDVNDIAIVVLNEPFQYTSHVQNISLPQYLETFSGYATATGWGRIKEKGPASEILKKVRLPIVGNEECARRYRKVHMKVTPDMMCAGEGGQDACQGDSGGPVVCKRAGGDTVICGIISHGYGCGRAGYPGVLTRLANYVPWIETTQKKITYAASLYQFTPKRCEPNSFHIFNMFCLTSTEQEENAVRTTFTAPSAMPAFPGRFYVTWPMTVPPKLEETRRMSDAAVTCSTADRTSSAVIMDAASNKSTLAVSFFIELERFLW